MISLPENHELIGFFEIEPRIVGPDTIPWEYQELTFVTQRGDDEVIVIIGASFSEFSISWRRLGKQLIQMTLIQLDSIRIEMQHNDEFLMASGVVADHTALLKLRLKPEVAIEFEQLHIR
nr:hypothetical protein [uncultured Undibacterium sp.]